MCTRAGVTPGLLRLAARGRDAASKGRRHTAPRSGPLTALARDSEGTGKIQWIFKPEEGGVAVLGWLEELLFVHQLPLSLQDADHDLLRRFLMTSVIRVQFRPDRGWQLIASDLISRSTWVLVESLTFLAAIAAGWSPVYVRTSPRVSAKAALTAPTRGECGVRFISRLRAWRHVFDNLYTTVRCYRSANCGCGTYAHIPSLKKGNQSALLAHV